MYSKGPQQLEIEKNSSNRSLSRPFKKKKKSKSAHYKREENIHRIDGAKAHVSI